MNFIPTMYQTEEIPASINNVIAKKFIFSMKPYRFAQNSDHIRFGLKQFENLNRFFFMSEVIPPWRAMLELSSVD